MTPGTYITDAKAVFDTGFDVVNHYLPDLS